MLVPAFERPVPVTWSWFQPYPLPQECNAPLEASLVQGPRKSMRVQEAHFTWTDGRCWGGLQILSSNYNPRKQMVEIKVLMARQKPGMLSKTVKAYIGFQCGSRPRKTLFSFLILPQLLSAPRAGDVSNYPEEIGEKKC